MMRIAAILCLLLLSGCSLPWKVASKPVESQKGGYATGAGGEIQQPVNSAQPSTQVSERETWYQQQINDPVTLPVIPVDQKPVSSPQTAKTGEKPANWIVVPPPQPSYTREKVTTSLGSHQDLAGIMTAASKLLGGSSMLLWFGILVTFGSGAAIFWSMNNPNGYMIVSALSLAIGMTWLVLGAQGGSSWWLLLAIFPVGLWLRQQAGFMKLIGL